jgi:hypothetical protein
MLYMNVKQIAEKAGVTTKRVYYIKDRIGHLPTVEEVKNYKAERKSGRPPKYTLKESEANDVKV